MDKFFQSAFDFFSYAVPGFVIVCISILFSIDFSDQDFLTGILKYVNLSFGIILLIPSYVLGFAITPIGKYVYTTIGNKIWKRTVYKKVDLHISEKFALVRQYTEPNFKYVESWNMFCTMSHNLAIASLLTFILSIIKVIKTTPSLTSIWVILIPISIVLFFIFLYRAVTFKHWAKNDLNAAIKTLNLIEKGQNNGK